MWHVRICMLLILVVCVGCPSKITCIDVGCPLNTECDVTTGVCEVNVSDCNLRPSLCTQDEFCDLNTGRCISSRIKCGRGKIQCPSGQACNVELEVCQSIGVCFSDQDCPHGEQCDTVTGRCVAMRCVQPQDCQSGFVCVAFECIAGCTDAKPCPATEFCRQEHLTTPGSCVSECLSDEECNFGYVCDRSLNAYVCVSEGPCMQNSECRHDEVCSTDRRCIQPPCTLDEECTGAQICDRTSGTCVGGDCVDDAFSPNHTPAQAVMLEQGTLTRLTRCPGRPDWYSIDVQSGEDLTVQLKGFDVDLDVYLLDANLRELRSDEQDALVATFTYHSHVMQRVFMLVTQSSLEQTSYVLSIDKKLGGTCVDDAYEENDSMEHAHVVTPTAQAPVDLPLSLCRDDQDWFVVRDLEASDGLHVEVRATQVTPRVDVYTPDGKVLSLMGKDRLKLERVGFDGDYVVRIELEGGSQQGSYRFIMSTPSEFLCSTQGIYSTPSSAQRLFGPNTLSNHTFCPIKEAWEIDWFELDPPKDASMLTLKVAPEHAPILRVALFVQHGANLDDISLIRTESSHSDGPLEIVARVEAGQKVFVRVSSDGRPGRIETPPSYQLVYQYRELF